MPGMTWRVAAILAALVLLGPGLQAGGWAVVTLLDVPERLIAGEPVAFTYAVRQHGRTLLSGLRGHVEARSAASAVRAAATALPDAGHYTATLTVPHEGEWTITITSGFVNGTSAPMTVHAVHRGSGVRPIDLVDRGRQLFLAKGCVACHDQREGHAVSRPVRVALPAKPYDRTYVERVLARRPAPSEAGMPDLGLEPAEVSALAVFLSRESAARAWR